MEATGLSRPGQTPDPLSCCVPWAKPSWSVAPRLQGRGHTPHSVERMSKDVWPSLVHHRRGCPRSGTCGPGSWGQTEGLGRQAAFDYVTSRPGMPARFHLLLPSPGASL